MPSSASITRLGRLFGALVSLAPGLVPAPGLSPAIAAPAPGAVRVGLLPAHDLSGSTWGTVLARSLQSTLFKAMSESRVLQPSYLNPGPLYSPLEPDSYLEHARAQRVDAVLVTTLQYTGKGPFTVEVKATLVPASAMTPEGPRLSARAEVRSDDTQRAALFDGAAFFGSNRQFDKQGLGKAAKKLTEAITTWADQRAPEVVPRGSGGPAAMAEGTCPVEVRVRYATTSRASKVYVLIFNGLEESLSLRDGAATIRPKAGPFTAHVSVKDAPYRLTVQDSYSFDGVVDCGRTDSKLIVEIGPAGDGTYRWE